MTAMIDVHELTVRYGAVPALQGASLQVQAGRVCALIGMNGAGKSTLLKALLGIVRADSGRIRIGGHSAELARRRGLIGYVPQSESVDWDFPISVREVVMTGRYAHLGLMRRPRAADRALVNAALARVQLTALADRQIGQLSGGQRKRAFVARAIASAAAILLLDEPFAGVDKRSEATMTALLRELAADGASVLVSTHDLHAVPALADEAALLRGRVLVHGSPREVLRPENLALAFGLDATTGSAPS